MPLISFCWLEDDYEADITGTGLVMQEGVRSSRFIVYFSCTFIQSTFDAQNPISQEHIIHPYFPPPSDSSTLKRSLWGTVIAPQLHTF